MSHEQLRQGGVMRCCMEALRRAANDHPVGYVLQCPYSDDRSHQLIKANDGVWEWNRPSEL